MYKILNNEKFRAYAVQFLVVWTLLLLGNYFATNTQENLSRQNIQTGFSFLNLEAGFDISETLIEYWSDDSYQRALGVGILNTIKVSVIGNIFAIMLGVLIGVLSFSGNYLLKKFSEIYVQIIRNIPLLLQLFFWYAILTEVLPDVKEALEILPNVFVTRRGIYIPFFADVLKFSYIAIALLFSWIVYYIFEYFRDQKEILSGVKSPVFERLNYLVYLIPVILWMLLGRPSEFSIPKLTGFNFQGGHAITPEFCALAFGLIIYTAAFIAEITRAGINSVGTGQWEAARSLGLSKSQTLKLIILPQSLRVMIPPLTSQILNLTKNSSLAVAIGYPDFVAITNTTMNQTGQAIECVSLIMLMYLILSLMTSFVMNLLNKKYEIKGNH